MAHKGEKQKQEGGALLQGVGSRDEGGGFESFSNWLRSWESPKQLEISGCRRLCELLPLLQVHVVALALGLLLQLSPVPNQGL